MEFVRLSNRVRASQTELLASGSASRTSGDIPPLRAAFQIGFVIFLIVAIAAIFSVTVAETLVGKAIFENHRVHIAVTLAVLGVTFWFLGRYLGRRRNFQAQFETGSEQGKHFLLFDLRYWGPMLVAE